MSEDTGIETGWEDSFAAWAEPTVDCPQEFWEATSISFGELVQAGYDWGGSEYTSYSMSEETLEWVRARLNRKIEARFRFRDIGVTPVGRWRSIFLYNLEGALDLVGPIYESIRNGFDITDAGLTQEKDRLVFSEFPQARLKVEEDDYATNMADNSKQTAGSKPLLDSLLAYQEAFAEADALVLDRLECCFSSFYSSSDF